jgi:hypothetical protein
MAVVSRREISGQALTRFGIYKIARRHASHLDDAHTDRRITVARTFRHTAAVRAVQKLDMRTK